MVIIDGFCASAWTIVLGTIPHDKICVTSRAKLGFHAAWDPGSNGRKITNPEATQTLYSMYPFEVRRWIDQRGGLTPQMIFHLRIEAALKAKSADQEIVYYLGIEPGMVESPV